MHKVDGKGEYQDKEQGKKIVVHYSNRRGRKPKIANNSLSNYITNSIL